MPSREDRLNGVQGLPVSLMRCSGATPAWVNEYMHTRRAPVAKGTSGRKECASWEAEKPLSDALKILSFVEKVRRRAVALGGNEDDAQDVLLGMWKAVVNGNWKEGKGNWKAFATKIAQRAIWRRWGDESPRKQDVSLEGFEEAVIDRRLSSPDWHMRVSEAFHAAVRFAAELSDDDWRVIVMRHGPHEDEKPAWARDVTGEEWAYLRCLRSRALKKLRQKLENIGVTDI